jgi:hypothetical protein
MQKVFLLYDMLHMHWHELGQTWVNMEMADAVCGTKCCATNLLNYSMTNSVIVQSVQNWKYNSNKYVKN